MKQILALLLLVALSYAGYWRIQAVQRERATASRKGGGGRAAPVLTAAATLRPMPLELRTFGTVEPSTTVTVRAQITGTLEEIGFREGEEVAAGQVLFRIAPQSFEADLRLAEAAGARSTAQLAQAETEERRISELFEKKFATENDRDQARTAVAAWRATQRADAATLENARIRLGYCTIRAPLAGRTGRLLVDPGNLVSAQSTALVTIHRMRPVRVGFTLPQQELPRVSGREAARDLTVEAILPGHGTHPESGLLTFLDHSVDRTTGTIALKAEFANEALRLWPGQFVTVRLVVAVETNALVIPFRAVQNGQKGSYVYVLQPDATVTDRVVTITRLVEEDGIVGQGLTAGEVVVTDGQQLLKPGAAVTNAALRTARAAESAVPAAGRTQGER
jgi:multidrug efflux system membrane fusion protein